VEGKNRPLLAQLPRYQAAKLPIFLASLIITLALLAFFLHGFLFLGYRLDEPYMVTTLLQLIAGALALGLIVAGRIIGGVRVFVVGIFLTIMVEPYVVSQETLAYSLVLLPPGLLAMVITSGLVFALPVSLGLAVLAAVNTAISYSRAAAEAGPLQEWLPELIPVASVLVLMSGLIVFLWVRITRSLLLRANGLVRERELLIQETNHRVKNNLQVITSFLDLQRRESEDSRVSFSLEVAAARIRAVAAVHHALHATGSEGDGELLPFLERLIEAIRESVGERPTEIRLNNEAPGVRIAGAAMVPLALVLNELITNAAQHGASEAGDAEITVTVTEEPETYRFSVKDSGSGFSPEFRAGGGASLGLTLVIALAEEQLEGTVTFGSENGGVVTVAIPRSLFIEPGTATP
jgi:two-component sensor histidine kinase